MSHFYTPWKRQKTYGLVIYIGLKWFKERQSNNGKLF